METKESIIYPKVGFGLIKFGLYPEDIIEILGFPEIIEDPNEEGDKIFYYENIGINYLCFDRDDGFRLTTIELNNRSKAKLWDKEIFGLSLKQIENISTSYGFSLKFEDSLIYESEEGKCIEEIYRIEELRLDFYFNKDKILEELSLIVSFNEKDEIEWPE